jgi:hypothetical protein
MPVTGPYRTFATSERSADDRIPVRAVRLAAVILPPSRFVRVLMEEIAADSMMLADLGAAQPRKVRLGLIHVRPVLGFVLD